MTYHENEVIETQYRQSARVLLRSYIIGFVSCLILSVLSFDLVEKRLLPDNYLYIALTLLVLAQFFVQVFFFLRLNSNSEEGRFNWNLMSFVFTILVIGIVVVGTLWIMYNLNYNMAH